MGTEGEPGEGVLWRWPPLVLSLVQLPERHCEMCLRTLHGEDHGQASISIDSWVLDQGRSACVHSSILPGVWGLLGCSLPDKGAHR